MNCKHNWVETKPKGAYAYIPQSKQYNFMCIRCGERKAALVREKNGGNT